MKTTANEREELEAFLEAFLEENKDSIDQNFSAYRRAMAENENKPAEEE